MQRYANSFANEKGRPVAGGSVTVRDFATNMLAIIYSDNGTTQTTNPLTTNENGEFYFYAADGRYTLVLSSDETETVTWPDVLLEDPVDGSSALAAASGSSLVGHIASGAGATATTVQSKLRITVNAEDYGCVGDGITDDSINMQEALDAVYAAGGGVVEINPQKRYLIDSADITIKARCGLLGKGSTGGQHLSVNPHANDYSAVPNALVLNSARTIRLKDSSFIRGMTIARKGITMSNNLRQGLDEVRAFAGTAITNEGVDSTAQDLFVIGFEKLYYSNDKQRLHVLNVQGDCNYGIDIVQCRDTGRVENVHLWNYLTGNRGYSTETFTITNVSDNGAGLIRITTSTANTLIDGDLVNIDGVVGTGGLDTTTNDKKWEINVIDSTHFDLNGSTFAGAYTSGGTIYPMLVWYRSGRGFSIETNTEGVAFIGCSAIGFDIGAYIGATAGWINFIDCQIDAPQSTHDFNLVGYSIQSTAYAASVVGGFVGPTGRQVVINTDNNNASHNFVGVAFSEPNGGTVVDMQSGRSTFSACSFRSGNIRADDSISSMRINGCDLGSAVLTFESSTARTKVFKDGVRQDGLIPSANGAYKFDTNDILVTGGATVAIGTATPIVDSVSTEPVLQVVGTSPATARGMLAMFEASANGATMVFGKSRNAAAGSHTVVQANDNIGLIHFEGSDGTQFRRAATITATVDGTPGASDMPGRLVFSTTADGAASTTERLRIDNTGALIHRNNATTIVDANSHLGLRSYTVGTLPSAGTAGRLIYVSDGTSNKRLAVSDGTNWRWPDGAVVS